MNMSRFKHQSVLLFASFAFFMAVMFSDVYWATFGTADQVAATAEGGGAQQARADDDDRSIRKTSAAQSYQQQQSKPKISSDNVDDAKNSTTTWTIVAQMGGELGNNLGNIAWGHGIQLRLEEDYNIRTRLLLKHQNHPKWKRGDKDIHKCFPHAAHLNFSKGWEESVVAALDEQDRKLGKKYWQDMIDNGEWNDATLNEGLDFYANAMRTWPDAHSEEEKASAGDGLSYPILKGQHIVTKGPLIDRYYDFFRKLFQFDGSCCKLRPEPDESVFHFRNFVTELSMVGKQLGLEELGPHETAYQLFGHLKASDKLAITTRYLPGSNVSSAYLQKFAERGIQARMVPTQTGVQDFCFLMQAQKELVGSTVSTFVVWAGLLGNCKKVTLYTLDTPGTRSRKKKPWYNFTHPELERRFHFKVFQPRSFEGSNEPPPWADTTVTS